MVVLQLQSINGFLFQCPKKNPVTQRRPRAQRYLCLQTQTLPSKTQRIMEGLPMSSEVGGAGGAYSYSALKRLDQVWTRICEAKTVVEEPKEVVSSFPGLLRNSDLADKVVDTFDVLICGGTLGIFVATALCAKGLRVGVIERNVLQGREQEWNISRKELLEFVEIGILTEDEIDQATAMKFNPNRCGFEGKGDIWVEDILNLGVSPVKLIEIVKNRFISLGGAILEGYSMSSISIYEDAAVSCRLVAAVSWRRRRWIGAWATALERQGGDLQNPTGFTVIGDRRKFRPKTEYSGDRMNIPVTVEYSGDKEYSGDRKEYFDRQREYFGKQNEYSDSFFDQGFQQVPARIWVIGEGFRVLHGVCRSAAGACGCACRYRRCALRSSADGIFGV